MKKIIFISINLILIFIINGNAFTPQPGSPMAQGVHPRLHITADDLAQIRSSIAANYLSQYQAYVNWAANADTTVGNDINDARHAPLRAVMVNQAFIAAIGQVPGINYPISLQEFANRAIGRLKSRLQAGQLLAYAAAIVYDWTYNFMTPAQRTQLVNAMVPRTIEGKVFIHSVAQPVIVPERLFSSKYFEACYAWYIALAFWGDGIADTEADFAVDQFENVMKNYGYLDAQNFQAGEGGGWSEWGGYGTWHPKTHYLLIDGWSTATGEDYISQGTLENTNAIGNFPKFFAFVSDPFPYYGNEFVVIRMGDADAWQQSFDNQDMKIQAHGLPNMVGKFGMTTEAGIMRYMIENRNIQWPDYFWFHIWAWLGDYKKYPSVNPETVYTKKYFWSRNLGVFVARQGFSNVSDGIFSITSGHFRFVGHDGPDDIIGFGINKFGTLVGTREVKSKGAANLSSYPGGFRTNSVYFESDHYANNDVMNDKGEFFDAVNGNGNYDHGGIEQVTTKTDYFNHVRVDFEKSYQPGVEHSREYIWLPGNNPNTDSDYLVIYDRTNAPSKPHWVYHVPWKPRVYNYDSVVDISTGSGEYDKIGDAYTGTNMILKELNGLGGDQDNDGGTADSTAGAGAHGVLFAKNLLPGNVRIELSRVAMFNSATLGNQKDNTMITHRWQVDVIPQNFQAEDRFLNVFQAADANNVTQMSGNSVITVSNIMEGVWIERENSTVPNSVVLFSRDNSIYAGTITYSVNGNGVLRHAIVGVSPGKTYTVEDISSSGTTSFDQFTETDIELYSYRDGTSNYTAGVLYFETNISGAHTFRLTISGNQDTDPPSIPTGLKIKQ